MPDVTSAAEQGLPGLVLGVWVGFFLPGDAPPALAEGAAEAIRWAAGEPALRAAFATLAMAAVARTPAGMRERIVPDRPAWRAFLTTSGIRAD